MKSYVLLFLVLDLVLSGRILLAQEKSIPTYFPLDTTSSTLHEGVWMRSSGHHVPWHEYHRLVRLCKSKKDGWLISFSTLTQTRESFEKQQPPHVRNEGPYPVHVADGVLHIGQPEGVFRYSCRFYRDIMQFPALVRVDDRTFNFTFSELFTPANSQKEVHVWSYTWVCKSAPSKNQGGEATLTIVSGKEIFTIPVIYKTEKHSAGPSLVFLRQDGRFQKEDRFVWEQGYGLQVYKSDLFGLGHRIDTNYRPANDTFIKYITAEPDKESMKVAPSGGTTK